MYTRNEIEKPYCPHCKYKIIEKLPHILLCSNKKAKSFYLEKINDLRKEMETITTCPTLTATILDILTKWRHGERIFLKNYDYKFHPAIREQTKIGWNNFAIGRWSKKWQLLQQQHYLNIILNCAIRARAAQTVTTGWRALIDKRLLDNRAQTVK